MAKSSLNRTGEKRPVTQRGHGTAALGPSDSSDNGSDIRGGPGLNRDRGIGLARGTTSDPDIDPQGAHAGPDIGDANIDSDSDRGGTGERGAAGRDSTGPTDATLRDQDDRPISEDFPNDVELDTTLATPDDRDVTVGETEDDVEREEPTSKRVRGKDVEANTPR